MDPPSSSQQQQQEKHQQKKDDDDDEEKKKKARDEQTNLNMQHLPEDLIRKIFQEANQLKGVRDMQFLFKNVGIDQNRKVENPMAWMASQRGGINAAIKRDSIIHVPDHLDWFDGLWDLSFGETPLSADVALTRAVSIAMHQKPYNKNVLDVFASPTGKVQRSLETLALFTSFRASSQFAGFLPPGSYSRSKKLFKAFCIGLSIQGRLADTALFDNEMEREAEEEEEEEEEEKEEKKDHPPSLHASEKKTRKRLFKQAVQKGARVLMAVSLIRGAIAAAHASGDGLVLERLEWLAENFDKNQEEQDLDERTDVGWFSKAIWMFSFTTASYLAEVAIKTDVRAYFWIMCGCSRIALWRGLVPFLQNVPRNQARCVPRMRLFFDAFENPLPLTVFDGHRDSAGLISPSLIEMDNDLRLSFKLENSMILLTSKQRSEIARRVDLAYNQRRLLSLRTIKRFFPSLLKQHQQQQSSRLATFIEPIQLLSLAETQNEFEWAIQEIRRFKESSFLQEQCVPAVFYIIHEWGFHDRGLTPHANQCGEDRSLPSFMKRPLVRFFQDIPKLLVACDEKKREKRKRKEKEKDQEKDREKKRVEHCLNAFEWLALTIIRKIDLKAFLNQRNKASLALRIIRQGLADSFFHPEDRTPTARMAFEFSTVLTSGSPHLIWDYIGSPFCLDLMKAVSDTQTASKAFERITDLWGTFAFQSNGWNPPPSQTGFFYGFVQTMGLILDAQRSTSRHRWKTDPDHVFQRIILKDPIFQPYLEDARFSILDEKVRTPADALDEIIMMDEPMNVFYGRPIFDDDLIHPVINMINLIQLLLVGSVFFGSLEMVKHLDAVFRKAGRVPFLWAYAAQICLGLQYRHHIQASPLQMEIVHSQIVATKHQKRTWFVPAHTAECANIMCRWLGDGPDRLPISQDVRLTESRLEILKLYHSNYRKDSFFFTEWKPLPIFSFKKHSFSRSGSPVQQSKKTSSQKRQQQQHEEGEEEEENQREQVFEEEEEDEEKEEEKEKEESHCLVQILISECFPMKKKQITPRKLAILAGVLNFIKERGTLHQIKRLNQRLFQCFTVFFSNKKARVFETYERVGFLEFQTYRKHLEESLTGARYETVPPSMTAMTEPVQYFDWSRRLPFPPSSLLSQYERVEIDPEDGGIDASPEQNLLAKRRACPAESLFVLEDGAFRFIRSEASGADETVRCCKTVSPAQCMRIVRFLDEHYGGLEKLAQKQQCPNGGGGRWQRKRMFPSFVSHPSFFESQAWSGPLSPYGGWQAFNAINASSTDDLVGYGSALDRVLPYLGLVVGELSQRCPDFSILGLIVLFVYTVGGSFLPEGVSQDDHFGVLSTMRLLETVHIVQAFGMRFSLVHAIHRAIEACLLEDDADRQGFFYFRFYDAAFIELFAQVREYDFTFDEKEEMSEEEAERFLRQRREAMHKLANAQRRLNAKLNGMLVFSFSS